MKPLSLADFPPFSLIPVAMFCFSAWQVKLLTELAHQQPCNGGPRSCYFSVSRTLIQIRILISLQLDLESSVSVCAPPAGSAVLLVWSNAFAFVFLALFICLFHVGRRYPLQFHLGHGYTLSLSFLEPRSIRGLGGTLKPSCIFKCYVAIGQCAFPGAPMLCADGIID